MPVTHSNRNNTTVCFIYCASRGGAASGTFYNLNYIEVGNLWKSTIFIARSSYISTHDLTIYLSQEYNTRTCQCFGVSGLYILISIAIIALWYKAISQNQVFWYILVWYLQTEHVYVGNWIIESKPASEQYFFNRIGEVFHFVKYASAPRHNDNGSDTASVLRHEHFNLLVVIECLLFGDLWWNSKCHMIWGQ